MVCCRSSTCVYYTKCKQNNRGGLRMRLAEPLMWRPEHWNFINLCMYYFIYLFVYISLFLNPSPTDDAFWRHQILAACYQLAQSILKISSALAERVGQGVHRSAWQSMAAVAAACWKALVNAGWAICLLSCTNGRRKRSFHLVRTQFLAF